LHSLSEPGRPMRNKDKLLWNRMPSKFATSSRPSPFLLRTSLSDKKFVVQWPWYDTPHHTMGVGKAPVTLTAPYSSTCFFTVETANGSKVTKMETGR